jgi:tetratricopeptide (TPR) repeat protein
MALEDLDAARESALQALRIDRAYAPAMDTLGRLAETQGDLAAAGEWFDRALALDPEDQSLLRARAGVKDTQYDRMVEQLRLLNDVLAGSPMAGRYWMFSGMLLGWAREGDLLRHDVVDVDFAYFARDEARLLEALPQLAAAGFEPLYRFPGAGAPATEYSFSRGGAKFEFFAFEVFRDRLGERFRYYSYGHTPGGSRANELELPAQSFEPVEFLGRTWLKVRDHEAELEALYGDWRTPDPAYDYMHSPAIARRYPWDNSSVHWNGEIEHAA